MYMRQSKPTAVVASWTGARMCGLRYPYREPLSNCTLLRNRSARLIVGEGISRCAICPLFKHINCQPVTVVSPGMPGM